MEFFFTLLMMGTFFGIGLMVRRYTSRVRFVLLLVSAFAPIWWYVIWQL